MKPSAEWKYDPLTGVIEREGLHIATNIHGVVVYNSEELKRKWAHVIAKKAHKWDLEMVGAAVAKAPLKKPEPTEHMTVTATSSPEVTFQIDGQNPAKVPRAEVVDPPKVQSIDTLKPEVAQAIRKLRYSQGYPPEIEADAPPKPKPTTGAGDKAKQLVEWYLRYDPVTFAHKYGVVKVGTVQVEKYRDDPTEPGHRIRYFAREEGHVLARRVTHLTHKLDNYERDRYGDHEKGAA